MVSEKREQGCVEAAWPSVCFFERNRVAAKQHTPPKRRGMLLFYPVPHAPLIEIEAKAREDGDFNLYNKYMI